MEKSFAASDVISDIRPPCISLLTITHVASYQHVALVTGAAVTAHSVVALMVTPSIPLAALVDICKQEGGTE